MTIRVNGRIQHHLMAPRSVVLATRDEVIPLGTGVWPVETGPAP